MKRLSLEYKKTDISIHHDKAVWKVFKTEKHFIISMTLILFLSAFFLTACECLESSKERESVETVIENPVPSVSKPPVNAMAPDKTETATFALG